MKIKIISVGNLEGQEIEVKNILAIRFMLESDPHVMNPGDEKWIDVNFSRENADNITVRGLRPIVVYPQAANAIDVALEL